MTICTCLLYTSLVRIRNGYYTDRVEGFSEDALVAALFCLSSEWFFPYSVPISIDKTADFFIMNKVKIKRPRPLRHRYAMPPPPKWEALAVHTKFTVLPRALPLGELDAERPERVSRL